MTRFKVLKQVIGGLMVMFRVLSFQIRKTALATTQRTPVGFRSVSSSSVVEEISNASMTRVTCRCLVMDLKNHGLNYDSNTTANSLYQSVTLGVIRAYQFLSVRQDEIY